MGQLHMIWRWKAIITERPKLKVVNQCSPFRNDQQTEAREIVKCVAILAATCVADDRTDSGCCADPWSIKQISYRRLYHGWSRVEGYYRALKARCEGSGAVALIRHL